MAGTPSSKFWARPISYPRKKRSLGATKLTGRSLVGSQTSLEVGIAPNSNDVADMVIKLSTAFIQQGMSLDSETQNSLGGFPSTVFDFTKAIGGAALAIVAAANNKLYVIAVDSDVPNDPAVEKEVDDMSSSFVIR